MSLPSTNSFSERDNTVRQAFVLEWMTVAWMIVEATVAILAALAAHSLSLLAFGADSIMELISAGVLLWRLTVELKHGHAFSERAEKIASRIGGALLFALALYVVVSAALSLFGHRGGEFSTPGLAITLAAIPMMWWLGRRKLEIAEQLGSRALRADAVESIACGYLSGAVVIGLIAQLATGAWWVDGATSLAIVYFLVKEGREAWLGESCSDDD